MSNYEPKDMSGSLFKNDKGENPARPDYRGDIFINGQVYKLAAWIKTGREGTKLAGQKYMSLSVKPKDEPVAYAPAPAPAAAPAPRMTQDHRDAMAIRERAQQERQAAAKPKTNFDDIDDDAPW